MSLEVCVCALEKEVRCSQVHMGSNAISRRVISRATMTTHIDAAARVALMQEYVEHKPDMVPSIYRLAGIAQAPCRVDGNGKPGPLSLEHTHVICATSKVTKEDPKCSTA